MRRFLALPFHAVGLAFIGLAMVLLAIGELIADSDSPLTDHQHEPIV